MIKPFLFITLIYSCSTLCLLSEEQKGSTKTESNVPTPPAEITTPASNAPLEAKLKDFINSDVKEEDDALSILLKGVFSIGKAVEKENQSTEPAPIDATITELFKFGVQVMDDAEDKANSGTAKTDEDTPSLLELLGSLAKLKEALEDVENQSQDSINRSMTGSAANPQQPTLDSVVIDLFTASGRILEEVSGETATGSQPSTNSTTKGPTLDSTLQDFLSVGTRILDEVLTEGTSGSEIETPTSPSTQTEAQQADVDLLKQQNEAIKKQLELRKELEALKRENADLLKQLKESSSSRGE